MSRREKHKKRNPQGPAQPPDSIAEQLVDHRRRGFLTGAVSAGAAAGAASLVQPDIAKAAVATPDDNHRSTYRETDHIRRAYERMRF